MVTSHNLPRLTQRSVEKRQRKNTEAAKTQRELICRSPPAPAYTSHGATSTCSSSLHVTSSRRLLPPRMRFLEQAMQGRCQAAQKRSNCASCCTSTSKTKWQLQKLLLGARSRRICGSGPGQRQQQRMRRARQQLCAVVFRSGDCLPHQVSCQHHPGSLRLCQARAQTGLEWAQAQRPSNPRALDRLGGIGRRGSIRSISTRTMGQKVWATPGFEHWLQQRRVLGSAPTTAARSCSTQRSAC